MPVNTMGMVSKLFSKWVHVQSKHLSMPVNTMGMVRAKWVHVQSKHLSMPVNTMGMVSSSSPSKYMYNLNI